MSPAHDDIADHAAAAVGADDDWDALISRLGHALISADNEASEPETVVADADAALDPLQWPLRAPSTVSRALEAERLRTALHQRLAAWRDRCAGTAQAQPLRHDLSAYEPPGGDGAMFMDQRT